MSVYYMNMQSRLLHGFSLMAYGLGCASDNDKR